MTTFSNVCFEGKADRFMSAIGTKLTISAGRRITALTPAKIGLPKPKELTHNWQNNWQKGGTPPARRVVGGLHYQSQ
jgi:hypothetical protein